MELVEGSQKIEQIFGEWPSFHDAEVLEITLDREAHGAVRGPTIRFTEHAFQMTDEVDSRGYHVLRNHVLVRFALHSAEVLRLEGFNLQNVLFGLHFSKPAEPAAPDLAVQVDLDSSYGVGESFQCARAEVISVEPYEPPERGA
jgi:hypothetical protein